MISYTACTVQRNMSKTTPPKRHDSSVAKAAKVIHSHVLFSGTRRRQVRNMSKTRPSKRHDGNVAEVVTVTVHVYCSAEHFEDNSIETLRRQRCRSGHSDPFACTVQWNTSKTGAEHVEDRNAMTATLQKWSQLPFTCTVRRSTSKTTPSKRYDGSVAEVATVIRSRVLFSGTC